MNKRLFRLDNKQTQTRRNKMADTGSVRYSVSITPITTIDTVSGQSASHDVINTDIGKSLGGSADVDTGAAGHTTVGYAAGTVAYGNAPANAGAKLALGSDATDYVMVFIKHTGFQYSSATALGAATTNNLIVYIETTADLATSAKFTIKPGGAVAIPNIDLGIAMGIWVESSSTDTIAVEYTLII